MKPYCLSTMFVAFAIISWLPSGARYYGRLTEKLDDGCVVARKKYGKIRA